MEFENSQKLHNNLDPLSTPGVKNDIFGHDTWDLKKSSRICIWTLFLPQRVEIGLIFALRAAVSEIQTDFQNYHIWPWNLESLKFKNLHMDRLFPRRVEIELIFTLLAAVS